MQKRLVVPKHGAGRLHFGDIIFLTDGYGGINCYGTVEPATNPSFEYYLNFGIIGFNISLATGDSPNLYKVIRRDL